MSRFRTLRRAASEVCLRHSRHLEISIRTTRLRPHDASTALPRPFIPCSGPPSAGQKAHSIPIDHSPASSKSAYRQCSGEQHSATPRDFCAGAFPIKPKDFRPASRLSGSDSTAKALMSGSQRRKRHPGCSMRSLVVLQFERDCSRTVERVSFWSSGRQNHLALSDRRETRRGRHGCGLQSS